MARTLAASGRATVGADGTAVVRIAGPHRPLTRWNLATVVVQSERVGDGTYPTCTVYRSVATPAYAIGTSRAADRVTFDASGDWLLAGDTLLVEVEGAAVGAVVVVSMSAVEVPL